MLLRPPEEAKNTIEHNIAAQERAHSVHIVCWADSTVLLTLPWCRCLLDQPQGSNRQPTD